LKEGAVEEMVPPFFYDKRGVSEVVASLMMIVLVSIASIVVYSYSVNTFASSSSLVQLNTALKEEQARERLSIIAVWWDNASQLNVTVLNYGKIELVIDAVYVDGVHASAYTSGKGDTVSRGGIAAVRFVSPVSIAEGHTYEIAAITERGSKDVVQWEA